MSGKLRKRYRELRSLKALILERGETYGSLAEKIGATKGTISNWLNGHYAIDCEYMDKIATELEIDQKDIAKFFLPAYYETQQKDVS